MSERQLPEDVRHLFFGFREPCDLDYREIGMTDAVRQAIERWPMFRELVRLGSLRGKRGPAALTPDEGTPP